MRADGPVTDVCVRNVSTRGMLLQACRAPAPGSYVEIVLPETSIVARVVWSKDRRFGVASRDRIRLADVIGPGAREPGRAAFVRTARQARGAALAIHANAHAEATGRAMQFLVLLICGVVAATFVAGLAYDALAELRDNLMTHL